MTTPTLPELEAEETTLILPHFDEHMALKLGNAIVALAVARNRSWPRLCAWRTLSSSAPRSSLGAAKPGSAASRPMSHSAVARTPRLTLGSPASRRTSVGTLTPMRLAQVLSDSLRRSLATARSAPSCASAAKVDGGICEMAEDDLGITYSLLKLFNSVKYMFSFLCFLFLAWQQCST